MFTKFRKLKEILFYEKLSGFDRNMNLYLTTFKLSTYITVFSHHLVTLVLWSFKHGSHTWISITISFNNQY